MSTISFSKEELGTYVRESAYKPTPDAVVRYRCSDCFYDGRDTQAEVVMPGGIVGEYAIVSSMAQSYGYEIAPHKVVQIVEGLPTIPRSKQYSCAYCAQLLADPQSFNAPGVQQLIDQPDPNLKPQHLEGAIVKIKGDYTVPASSFVENVSGKYALRLYLFHQTFLDAKHRELARRLIDEEVIRLLPGLDEEYLYEILADATETQFLLAITKTTQNLPIYAVTFSPDGQFTIEEL